MKRSDKSPAALPRAVKRSAGATDVATTPLTIRAPGLELSADLEETIRTRLARKLGKFAARIERMSVRFEDVNGPRGGVDISCRATVALRGLPSVVVNASGATDLEAFVGVERAMTRAVKREIEKVKSPKRSRS